MTKLTVEDCMVILGASVGGLVAFTGEAGVVRDAVRRLAESDEMWMQVPAALQTAEAIMEAQMPHKKEDSN